MDIVTILLKIQKKYLTFSVFLPTMEGDIQANGNKASG
jgi:hypothetical protein